MAATVLTLALKTYDAALVNLTTMTGGVGATVGYTGADWIHTNTAGHVSSPESCFRKKEGGRQIAPALVTTGGTPTTANSPASFAHTFTRTSADMYSTGTSFIGTGGCNVGVTTSQFGSGIGATFRLTRDLQTLWWLGWVRNATCQAAATMSDGAATVSNLALPVGAFNVYTPAWFECTFRGTYAQVQNEETVTVNVIRTGGATVSGQIHSRAWVLLVPVTPPRPKGLPPGSR
jgi:hypothetical protein